MYSLYRILGIFHERKLLQYVNFHSVQEKHGILSLLGKEHSVVLVFFGCLHTWLFVSRTIKEGLPNKSIQRLLKLCGYIYRSINNCLAILWYFSVHSAIIVMNACIRHIVIWCKIKVIGKHLPFELSLGDN